MVHFETFDEILDFAIVQERAAQAFYANLAGEADNADMRRFYESLVEQESIHEEKLTDLKSVCSQLSVPDLEDLQKCGYLDALPLHPEADLKQVLQYLIKKEKSAKMLYTVLANSVQRSEMADLFNVLAAQEADHAEFFKREFEELNAAVE